RGDLVQGLAAVRAGVGGDEVEGAVQVGQLARVVRGAHARGPRRRAVRAPQLTGANVPAVVAAEVEVVAGGGEGVQRVGRHAGDVDERRHVGELDGAGL